MNNVSLDRSRLSAARPGDRGVIVKVGGHDESAAGGLEGQELERRLLEFGFVEGAGFELLHEGAVGRCPIAVRLGDMRVALRRRDAHDVWVALDMSPR